MPPECHSCASLGIILAPSLLTRLAGAGWAVTGRSFAVPLAHACSAPLEVKPLSLYPDFSDSSVGLKVTLGRSGKAQPGFLCVLG